MANETDAVLSAIRRGEDSLPKLRSATGLEYAKLHVVLHDLEFESRAITRNETADGFDRYTVSDSNGNGFKGTHWKDAQTTPTVAPQATARTRAATDAREMALLQRGAPYCVVCRSLCVLHGSDRHDRVRWRCRQCSITFFGSGNPGEHHVNWIEPEKREKAISAFNEGKSVRKVAEEVGIAQQTAQKIRTEEQIEALCGCGQNSKHKGWCAYRFQQSPARQAIDQYVIEGVLRLNISLNISMADMALWPSYDISSFFSALATLQKLGNRHRAT